MQESRLVGSSHSLLLASEL